MMKALFISAVLLFSFFDSQLEAAQKSKLKFQPPKESEIPNDEFGNVVREGQNIFLHTQQYAKSYVGNSLNCVNCHLNAGRLPNSAPLWAAYVLYPAYRKKTKKVDTMASRIQGCFQFSMNGKVPAADSEIITSLQTYMYWLAQGAPTGQKLEGQGYLKLNEPKQKPTYEAGKKVYEQNCSVCHGPEGQGQFANGETVFPPLWGEKSFNWGAGMHRVDTAASFIKANMPLGRGGMLTDQEAWDVAFFVNSHDRPKDPRQKDLSIQEAKEKFHKENCNYGEHN